MKKLVSISFIVVLLLNVMGYYAVFLGIAYQHDMEMIRVLDGNAYDESAAITLTIPVSIPYRNDDSDFKRAYGKFEHQGQHFRLVKQKYANNTLYIVCVRDYEKERITEALSTYLKSFADAPVDPQQQSNVTFTFIKEYISQAWSLMHDTSGWEADLIQCGFCIEFKSTFSPTITHPPEA